MIKFKISNIGYPFGSDLVTSQTCFGSSGTREFASEAPFSIWSSIFMNIQYSTFLIFSNFKFSTYFRFHEKLEHWFRPERHFVQNTSAWPFPALWRAGVSRFVASGPDPLHEHDSSSSEAKLKLATQLDSNRGIRRFSLALHLFFQMRET